MNNELYEKLTRLQWLLHIQQMDDYRQGGHLADTTRGQGRVLAALQMRDGISTRDLSFLLGLAVSSLNEFLSKLEKGGHITREPSEQDKRVMLVKLTEKGKTHQIQQEATTDFGSIFDCLSEEEQAAFGAYLDKIIAALGEKFCLDEETLEWLKAANDERNRMFAEGFAPDRRGFDHRGFRGGFAGQPDRHGFPHGRGGFGRKHNDEEGKSCMSTEGLCADKCGADTGGFRGGFAGQPDRRGFQHGRGGLGRKHNGCHGKEGHKD